VKADTPVHCRTCQATVQRSNRFCPACGELYPAVPEADLPAAAGPLLPLADELAPLAREKASLAAELEGLIEKARVRQLTGDERVRWEQAYARWRDVTAELTEKLDPLIRRSDDERRSREYPPGTTHSPKRSGDDRRDPFWSRIP
jgi:hypothetical protein